MSRDKLYGDWERRVKDGARPVSWRGPLARVLWLAALIVLVLVVRRWL